MSRSEVPHVLPLKSRQDLLGLPGSVIGFLLSWDGEDGAVWITGDTVLAGLRAWQAR